MRNISLATAAAALAFLLTAFSAQANIGETHDQLIARYGNGHDGGEHIAFSFKDKSSQEFFISVYMTENRSSMEIISHKPDGNGDRTSFTPEELKMFLDQQASGGDWIKMQEKDGQTLWMSGDKKIFARYSPSQKVLVFLGKR